VHDPMHEGRQGKRRHPDAEQAGKQRVARGEQFPGVAGDRIDGPRPSEDHRCVDQGVDPGQTAEVVIPPARRWPERRRRAPPTGQTSRPRGQGTAQPKAKLDEARVQLRELGLNDDVT